MAKIASHVPAGSRLLDVGCNDGALFAWLGSRVREGVGIDAHAPQCSRLAHVQLIRGSFPDDLPALEPFDVITMLAVLEHVPVHRQHAIAGACAELLRPGGLTLITSPAPVADVFLDVMRRLRLIHGMDLDQHYGFDPRHVPGLFGAASLELLLAQRFELGLNHLFVFRRPA
jgi:2-polyprenyl-3-methyl-5-hydroxy-6-metoxy-1,4-benzoquinol methylase